MWIRSTCVSQVAQWKKNRSAGEGDAGRRAPSPGQEDPLEEDMATHSSVPAWRIPWAEEPGGLQSMGLKGSDTAEQK